MIVCCFILYLLFSFSCRCYTVEAVHPFDILDYYKEGCHNVDAMRYLIGFENPLEILRDGIVCDMDGDINSIDNSLWEIYDRRSADYDYEKDYKYYEAPKPGQGLPFGM